MTKTITFVGLYTNKNDNGCHLAFDVNGTFVSSNDIPPEMTDKFVTECFEDRVTKDGEHYFGSKFPLVVEHGDIREGKVKGRYFVNAVSVTKRETANVAELRALFVKPEQKPAETADNGDNF